MRLILATAALVTPLILVSDYSDASAQLVLCPQGQTCNGRSRTSSSTPEERARREVERVRVEAENARQNAAVDEEMARRNMPAHRRAEIERLQQMREAAAKARGEDPRELKLGDVPVKTCVRPAYTMTLTTYAAPNEAAAFTELQKEAGLSCDGKGGTVRDLKKGHLGGMYSATLSCAPSVWSNCGSAQVSRN